MDNGPEGPILSPRSYQSLSKTIYHLTLVCWAIAVNDEDIYKIFFGKLKQTKKSDPDYETALMSIEEFNDYNFEDVRNLCIFKNVKELMNKSLCFTIRAERQNIAFDLL
jgi:hypothetical protein